MPNVTSFILRFTQPATPEQPGRLVWYGLLRNVETNEQIHFTCIEQALNFLGQYVDIDQKPNRKT